MSCYRAPVEVESIGPIVMACELACIHCRSVFHMAVPLGFLSAREMVCPLCLTFGSVRDVDEVHVQHQPGVLYTH